MLSNPFLAHLVSTTCICQRDSACHYPLRVQRHSACSMLLCVFNVILRVQRHVPWRNPHPAADKPARRRNRSRSPRSLGPAEGGGSLPDPGVDAAAQDGEAVLRRGQLLPETYFTVRPARLNQFLVYSDISSMSFGHG
jgi:hypothetical protein